MNPRFTIAHILLFTAIVGLIIGWILDRTQLNKRYQANTELLQKVLASVNTYESEIQPHLVNCFAEGLTQDQFSDINYLRNEVFDLKSECHKAYDFFVIQFGRQRRGEIK